MTILQNLMSLEWRPKKVEASGNMQFEATDATGAPRFCFCNSCERRMAPWRALRDWYSGDVLMMLPTDMALKTDPVFAQHAAAYVLNARSCSLQRVHRAVHGHFTRFA